MVSRFYLSQEARRVLAARAQQMREQLAARRARRTVEQLARSVVEKARRA